MSNCTVITIKKSASKTCFYSAHCGRISCPHCRPDRQVPLNTTARCQSDASASSKTSAPARPGISQVPYNELNTQDSGSHISQMSGPLFTEDRLSTSSGEADACDTKVLNITNRSINSHDVFKTWIPFYSTPPGVIQINKHSHQNHS